MLSRGSSYVPRYCVYGMRAISGVCDRSFALLLGCVVGEGFASGMLAVPDCLWESVIKANHVVLPRDISWELM